MAELGLADQAAGLRRLFGNRNARSVCFIHLRRTAGAALTLARTASALAERGRSVVVVDEHGGRGSVTELTGQRPDFDLFDVFIGDCDLNDALLAVTPRISVLPAMRAAREFGPGEVDIAPRMAACMAELGVRAGYVLLDGSLRQGTISELARTANHLALVARPSGRSVTDAYALIKRLSQDNGRRDFQMVVEGVGKDLVSTGAARMAFQNLQATARKHLDLELGHLATLVGQDVNELAEGLLKRLPSGPAKLAEAGNVLPLRGIAGLSGLFESVV